MDRATGVRTADLLQTKDWQATPLGPRAAWPCSLASYVSMIQALPTPAVVFWGPELVQVYNDGYSAILGQRHPRCFGERFRDAWPDTYPIIHPWLQRVLQRGEVVEVEREHIGLTRHGFEEEAYFTFTFSPLTDDEGRIAGVLHPVFEVTDVVFSDRRADTLRALAAEAHALDPVSHALAALATNPGDITFASIHLSDGPGGGLRYAEGSPGVATLHGSRPRLEAAAREVLATREPVHLAEPAALLLPLQASPAGALLGVITLGLSRRVPFDARLRVFLETVARQTAYTLQRAEAQRALARHRAYLDELFLRAPAGIAVLEGPALVFRLVNPRYREHLGGRELLGLPFDVALPEPEARPLAAALREVLQTGRPHIGTEVPSTLGGEREAYFDFVMQPLGEGDGRPGSVLVFCHDVSSQVCARRRAEALTEALRQEHRRKDDFLAMLAHELRNPLAPLAAAAEVLQAPPADSGAVVAAGAIVARQVRHMAALVGDMLEVSRVTRGLIEIERHPQDLKQAIAEALEQVGPLVRSRRHRLHVALAPGDAWVVGDGKRLVQILANLLNNAAKYTPEGGEIRLVLERGDAEAVVRVQDNGIGIPPELLPRVFDLFVQGERPADRAQGGLGIGLALVRLLAGLHGGRAEGFSAGPGRGSEFVLALPRTPRPVDAAAPAPADPPAARRATGRRVLVVDDNEDAAEMLALLLRSAGHRTRVAHDAATAMQLARAEPPDAALLDIGLPGEDGHALARQLRAQAGGAALLLIAITGYGQDSDRQRAEAAGFDHFIVKPADPRRLEALLAAPR